ncbi:heavy-metal-associated domain-containing protein [Halohasta litorea]|uniref:Heavy-metal-associated domain-containing protein n=1 Tax=Halohasta litorea TaxID=869891 RepID=A0ABD6D7H2_9EURY|nr:heavy metal-associated domain-containing protein [Halohasta litorea]
MSQTLAVSGMSCTGCESNVESAVSELPGCTGVEADHEAGTVTVDGEVDEAALREAIEDSGYELSE